MTNDSAKRFDYKRSSKETSKIVSDRLKELHILCIVLDKSRQVTLSVGCLYNLGKRVIIVRLSLADRSPWFKSLNLLLT
ncbi:MAG TPA: hypothetical protein V6D14_33110 [Coleofasciculaceae cyanobacterium]|jgi:hypothetical protein